MGIVFGRFRKKKTSYEILEKIESEIKSIEEFCRSTEQRHKKIVGRFVLISIFIYIGLAVIFYFYFFPPTIYKQILYVIPLIVALPVILAIKSILTWYYNRKLQKNRSKLSAIKNEKKKLLEDVMNKETYKVATSILEKFAPEEIRKNSFSLIESTPLKTQEKDLRYRKPVPTATSAIASTPNAITPFNRSQMVPIRQRPPLHPVTPLPLPRAVLPRDRSAFDKMVDYLVGDGPSNRYALICNNCAGHNGMALKEEFEYLSFRCCYCGMINPARKQRPVAPKLLNENRVLPPTTSESEQISNSSDSSSDEDEAVDGEEYRCATADEDVKDATISADVEDEDEKVNVNSTVTTVLPDKHVDQSIVNGNGTKEVIDDGNEDIQQD